MSSRPIKKGRFWYTADRIGGRQIWVKLSASKQLADDLWHTYEQDKDRGRFGVAPKGMTFDDACETYLTYSKGHKSPRSYSKDFYVVNLFKKLEPIAHISEYDNLRLDNYVNKRIASGVTEETVNRELNTLKHMGSMFKTWHLTGTNQVIDTRRFPKNKSRKDRFLSVAEVRKLLNGSSGAWKTIFTIAVYTGARREEILRLRWDAIDYDNMQVKIMEVNRKKPKDKEFRPIPLHPALEKHLKSIKKRHEYIACYEGGSLMSSDTLTSYARKRFRQLRIPGATVNTLRHTFGSQLTKAGVPLKIIQQYMGHASITTTERYAHLAPEYLNQQEHIRKLPY